jgi:hypothetical protein
LLFFSRTWMGRAGFDKTPAAHFKSTFTSKAD